LSFCEEKLKYKKEGVGIGKASEGFTLRLFFVGSLIPYPPIASHLKI